MQIANPLYDTVFKHLMADAKIAIGIISRILDLKIVELIHQPQEITHAAVDYVGNGVLVQIYRIDFHAIIEDDKENRKKVLIELQKAVTQDCLLRFRSYLGKHYMLASPAKSAATAIRTAEERGDKFLGEEPITLHEAAPVTPQVDPATGEILPIVAIYLLGFNLKTTQPKVLHVKKAYYDGITKLQCVSPERDPFVEGLTHEAVFVQLNKKMEVEGREPTELEELLSIFKQKKFDATGHFLTADGTLLNSDDPLIKLILRTLNGLCLNEEELRNIAAEDELTRMCQYLTHADTALATAKEETSRAKVETSRAKEEISRAKEEISRANREIIEEKQRTEEERQRTEDERQRTEVERQRNDKYRALLEAAGINPDLGD